MIELPDIYSIDRIADWAELYIILYHKPLSKSEMIDLIEAEEEDIDSTINELKNRFYLYGDASPFVVDGKSIRPKVKWEDEPELTMCLIFSLRGVEKKKGEDDGTKLFERLSREAVKSYLSGEAEVIGFPNAGRLREQMQRLSMQTCEEIGHRCPRPQDKDKGVDIVAWKPHGDGRPNQIVLLLQCGAGANFSQKKAISIVAWREFMHWSAEPIPGIMIPQIVSKEDWIDTRDDYYLIFDRVRIYKAIYNKSLSDPGLRGQILAWCKSRIKQI